MEQSLEERGYAIVENVLSERRVNRAKRMFHRWVKRHPTLLESHEKTGVHGIFKYHQVAHQKHAWYIRTRNKVQKVFQHIWKTDKLVTSFDGCCYIPSSVTKRDNCWTHTDQAPNKKGKICIQGFVALTTNEDRTLVVYEGSHLLHESYMKEYGETGSKNWLKIDPAYLERIADKKKVLHVKAGSLVLWDSRTFHQNQYGEHGEERLVQYVCFLPREDKKNTTAIQEKRIKYLKEYRVTSHWSYPLHVNGLQPRTFGNKSLLIDYSQLKPPNLSQYEKRIKLII
jgi:ectoine hydroxylase-related dioxygenase (phytanoyl-CoA dioxygenase family)